MNFIFTQIGGKCRLNVGAIFVNNTAVRDYNVAPIGTGSQCRKPRRKQEKVNFHTVIKIDNSCQNRERWIINDNTAIGIFEIFKISSRIKRSDYLATLDLIFVDNPLLHRLIDIIRCITVVSRFFRLEFFDKCVVFWIITQFCMHVITP